MIILKSLRMLAIIFGGHLWLKEWHWRSIQVEFRRHILLSICWLICQLLNKLVCLDLHVKAAGYWLWTWNITVWIDISDFRRLIELLLHTYLITINITVILT